jgi:hypothetical protein
MRAIARHRLRLLLLVRDAAEQVLVQHAGLRIQQSGRRTAAVPERLRGVADVVVVDAIGDFGPERGLGHMRIDVDDEVVRQLARFLRRVGQHVARIGSDRDLLQFAHNRRGTASSRSCHGRPPAVAAA